MPNEDYPFVVLSSMKIRFLAPTVLIGYLLLGLSSCHLLTPDEVLPGLEAYAPKTDVQAYEVVSIFVKDTKLSQAHYTGQFGSEDITIGRANDTLLIAMVPNIAGTFSLKATVEGKLLDLEMKVTAASEVTEPAVYLDEFVKQANFGQLEASLDAQIAAGTKSREAADATLKALQQAQAETLQMLQQATAEEIKEAASFIAVNRYLFDEIESSLAELRLAEGSNGGRVMVDAATRQKLLTLTFALAKIGAVVGGPALVMVELGALIPGGVVGTKLWASAGATLGIAIFRNQIIKQKEIAVQAVLDLFDDSMVAVQKSLTAEFQRTAQETFENGQLRKVNVNLRMRNLQPSDLNSEVSLYRNFVLAYNILTEFWNSYMAEFGNFPAMLPLKESTLTPAFQNMSLHVVDNADVTGSLQWVDGQYMAVFTSNVDADQDFTARFTYTEDYIDPIEWDVDSHLKVIDCGEGISTAPVITGVSFSCGYPDGSNSDKIAILISFTADGPGIIAYDGFGYCELADACYPTRLYFLDSPASTWQIAANGYDAELVSGTINAGVVAITIKTCQEGKSARQSLDANYPGYQWKVQLINKCNQRSAEVGM
ncbi:MAG: hypothetical protein RIF36_13620 [Imperialibacter sp.]|uniref:hypothetical protein n=1 Tax=Imperialibacter sp. TaxID=2038411 RepID=UPI0032EE91B8